MPSFAKRRAMTALRAAGALSVLRSPHPAHASPGDEKFPRGKYLTAHAAIPSGPRGPSTTSTSKGRRGQAKAINPAEGISPRTKCETLVGGWGGRGSDGGHLIAATLKGVSQRFSLVPLPPSWKGATNTEIRPETPKEGISVRRKSALKTQRRSGGQRLSGRHVTGASDAEQDQPVHQ
ncbi:hypothetical protein [Streptomyces spirodelae]|uniref:Uncharacterized protein n=1 Tax=Streptomyces spirodelae TaxID=2812904 RepID=A0ABS3WTK5_9ACTN|nr:hypothetical protein [Streptomyces spirodelae]MBO8186438.1 hypothetical protein [Streptomyces spirodelae]